jgi:hypothetical protein
MYAVRILALNHQVALVETNCRLLEGWEGIRTAGYIYELDLVTNILTFSIINISMVGPNWYHYKESIMQAIFP